MSPVCSGARYHQWQCKVGPILRIRGLGVVYCMGRKTSPVSSDFQSLMARVSSGAGVYFSVRCRGFFCWPPRHNI